MSKNIIVWLHNDLRLSDHPALAWAASNGRCIPTFVYSPDDEGDWAPGGAHKWWLHHSLESLAKDLEDAGSRLTLRKGSGAETIIDLCQETNADAVVWNIRYEPALRRRDDEAKKKLESVGVEVRTFQGRLLHEPDAIRTTEDNPYRVFTPFWKRFASMVDVDEPLGVPDLSVEDVSQLPNSISIDALNLLPEIDWAGGLRETWEPGETAAQKRLDRFIDEAIGRYHDERDIPSADGTSMLSPHLRFGEISPRQIWRAVKDAAPANHGAESYLRELGWREFSYHLLYHYPETTLEPLNDRYRSFPWQSDAGALKRWQKGRTGYPIVDAGMKQLWHTGWMHNRVRMIVASFLTKDLLLPWQEGARWFWDTLVDGDLANNTQGWQWSAGSGADAQPFFRIFNPVSQGKKFDPDGDYVREWIPALADLPNKFVHAPWEAPDEVLESAGVKLGDNYPTPIVDHSVARKEALEAYEQIR